VRRREGRMPRVKTTRMVKIALYGLIVYLVIMLSLIAVKFVRTYLGHSSPSTPPAASAPAPPTSAATLRHGD
jgi:hypothetical protein